MTADSARPAAADSDGDLAIGLVPSDTDADHLRINGLYRATAHAAETSDSGCPDVEPYEQAVLDCLSRLTHAPDHVRGAITSSSTEALAHGIRTAHHHLPCAPLYASSQAHNAVARITARLRMDLVILPSRPDGTLDPAALNRECQARRQTDLITGRPPRGAVVVATLGTAAGALDDPAVLRQAAQAAGEVHVHADATLGMHLTALDAGVRWDFAAGISTLSGDLHTLLGLPAPAGVILTPEQPTPAAARPAADSRNALAVLLVWMQLRRHGTAGLRDSVNASLQVAAYAHQRLKDAGWNPWTYPGGPSNVVVFDAPTPRLKERWRLGVIGRRAHLLVHPRVTAGFVDELLAELGPRQRPVPAIPPQRHPGQPGWPNGRRSGRGGSIPAPGISRKHQRGRR